MRAEVWVLDSECTVLCQIAGMGVPAAVVVASDGTVGGTYFAAASYLGAFEIPDFGWGKAGDVTREEATKRGYRVEFYDPYLDDNPYDEDSCP